MAFVADDASKKTLHGIAKEYILPESTVYMDGAGMQGWKISMSISYNRRNDNQPMFTSLLGKVVEAAE